MAPNDQSNESGGARGGIDGWREVWEKGLLPGRRRPLFERLSWLISGIYKIGAGPVQRSFNLAVLEMMEDRRRDIDDLRRDFEQIAADVRELERRSPIAVERNDALFVMLDQKIESALSRLRDISLPTAAEGGVVLPESVDPADWQYRRLEEALRGPSAKVRDSLLPVIEHLKGNEPVIDVGCGRGELLELCRDNGIEARGFDVNERSVAELKEKGFDVEVGSLPGCLAELEESSAGAIVAVHVLEHLPADIFMRFFADASRALREGGLLVVETPNADSVRMSAGDFWRDPTHLAPRHEASIISLGTEAGMTVVESVKVHPWDPGDRLSVPETADPALRELTESLNALIFAPQDLRVVLKR